MKETRGRPRMSILDKRVQITSTVKPITARKLGVMPRGQAGKVLDSYIESVISGRKFKV